MPIRAAAASGGLGGEPARPSCWRPGGHLVRVSPGSHLRPL